MTLHLQTSRNSSESFLANCAGGFYTTKAVEEDLFPLFKVYKKSSLSDRRLWCSSISLPSPSNGGQDCPGVNYEYQLCNTDDCPKHFEDFRAQQCQLRNSHFEFQNAKHHWLPYEHPDGKPEKCQQIVLLRPEAALLLLLCPKKTNKSRRGQEIWTQTQLKKTYSEDRNAASHSPRWPHSFVQRECLQLCPLSYFSFVFSPFCFFPSLFGLPSLCWDEQFKPVQPSSFPSLQKECITCAITKLWAGVWKVSHVENK